MRLRRAITRNDVADEIGRPAIVGIVRRSREGGLVVSPLQVAHPVLNDAEYLVVGRIGGAGHVCPNPINPLAYPLPPRWRRRRAAPRLPTVFPALSLCPRPRVRGPPGMTRH